MKYEVLLQQGVLNNAHKKLKCLGTDVEMHQDRSTVSPGHKGKYACSSYICAKDPASAPI